MSTRLIVGGSQENTVLSCEGQCRLGHEVHLAFGPIYGPEGSMLERVRSFRAGDGAGIRTHVVPSLVREVSPLMDWRARRELRALVESQRPDVVHTHSSKAGIVGRLAAWDVLRSRPTAERPAVVHTIHGPPFMPLEGGWARRAGRWAMNRMYEEAERVAARRCHAIVSVADAMTEQFLARGIGRAEQYETVLSGMEVEAFLSPGRAGIDDRAAVRGRLGIGEREVVVGTVARLAEHKGHDDLLEALGEALRGREDLRLLWVGDGWWRERLVARARSMGLGVRELDADGCGSAGEAGARVILTGLVEPSRVPEMLRAMDVLAHPSRREGLPRTVPQALLSGVAVVAYDCDGTREVCRDGETGRLVRAGDVAGLGSAVMALVGDALERGALAARGREWCRVRFDAAEMVRRLEVVYARALSLAREEAR